MSTTTFLTLLSVFSVITSLVMEAAKPIIEERKLNVSYNLLVMCISMVVGIIGMSIYYFSNGTFVGGMDIVYILLMGIANGICAMVGYDKVVQALKQMGL